MSGRRRKKSRRKRKGPQAWRTLQLSLPEVEIIKGHDGFMRGKPEPVLLVAAYAIAQHIDGQANLLGRVLKRIKVAGPYPERIVLEDGPLLRRPLSLAQSNNNTILLLVAALERDSGKDLQELYSALSQPSRLQLWPAAAEVPAPAAIAEAAASLSDQPQQVQLLLDQEDLSDTCQQDKWIGASAFLIQLRERRQQWQLNFRDTGARNDWTATLDFRC